MKVQVTSHMSRCVFGVLAPCPLRQVSSASVERAGLLDWGSLHPLLAAPVSLEKWCAPQNSAQVLPPCGGWCSETMGDLGPS